MESVKVCSSWGSSGSASMNRSKQRASSSSARSLALLSSSSRRRAASWGRKRNSTAAQLMTGYHEFSFGDRWLRLKLFFHDIWTVRMKHLRRVRALLHADLLPKWHGNCPHHLVLFRHSHVLDGTRETLLVVRMCLMKVQQNRSLCYYSWSLTLTAPPRSGGGCVSRYSVACSMVLVFNRASMACSLEKPISISWKNTKKEGK